MQKRPIEVAVTQNKLVQLDIPRTVIATWLIRFQRNASYGPEINGNSIVYIGSITFEIRTRAVRHVIMEHARELALEQKLNLHQVGDPIKIHTDLFKYGYIPLGRTRHFRCKGQCATEIQLLNTPHDRRCSHGRQAMTPLWCNWINTLCFPQKNWRVNIRDRGWGRQRYLPPRLRGDMATPTAIALDSSFNLLLISRILVDTNGNGQHHVIIGINHG